MNKYSTYFDAYRVIQASYAENSQLLSNMGKYFRLFRGDLSSIITKLINLQNSQLESKKAQNPQEFIDSDFSRYWLEIKDHGLDPVMNFEYMDKDLSLILANSLDGILREYKDKMEAVLKSAHSSIQKMESIKKQYDNAHKAYMQSGANLRNAYDNHAQQKLQQLRDEFMKNQKNAIAMNRRVNEQQSSFCDEFESFLSDFEQIEQWRTEHLKMFFKELAGNVERSAALFHASATQVEFNAKRMDPDSDSKMINQDVGLKQCKCSPVFQIIPIMPIASNFLDPNVVFEKEINEGGRIAKSKSQFRGNQNQLDITPNELLVVLREEDDQYVCKNINECIGLVPKDIIEFSE